MATDKDFELTKEEKAAGVRLEKNEEYTIRGGKEVAGATWYVKVYPDGRKVVVGGPDTSVKPPEAPRTIKYDKPPEPTEESYWYDAPDKIETETIIDQDEYEDLLAVVNEMTPEEMAQYEEAEGLIPEPEPNKVPDDYPQNTEATTSVPIPQNLMGLLVEKAEQGELNRDFPLTFGAGLATKFTSAEADKRKALLDKIQNVYSDILDSAGLNFRDPLEAYGKYFNKRMDIAGLDPPMGGMNFIFFTRPDLNLLRYDKDVGLTRFFEYMLSTKIGNFVAEYLQYPKHYPQNIEDDQSLYGGQMNLERSVNRGVADRVVLDKAFRSNSAFDPLKSNTCKSLQGGKDFAIDSYTGYSNFSGHEISFAKGADGFDSQLDLTATFNDTSGCPIFLSNLLHIQYIHEVARGYMRPKYKYIWQRVLDYTFSIYVFKLAEDNETIIRWAKYTGCYPVSLSLDTINNYKKEVNHDEYNEVVVTYKCNFYDPMDPAIFIDFNKLCAPLAIQKVKNIDIFKEAESLGLTPTKKFKNGTQMFRVRDSAQPARLLDKVGAEAAKRISRNKAVFSETPYIYGNKLLFI